MQERILRVRVSPVEPEYQVENLIMKCSTDFSKSKNQRTVLCRFWLCVVLFSCMAAETVQAQDCASSEKNLQKAIAAYNAWADRHKDLLEECYSGSGEWNKGKSGTMIPHYAEMDANGKLHHYEGGLDSAGELVWTETDEDPNKSGSSGKVSASEKSDLCDSDIAESEKAGDGYESIVNAVGNIGCDIYIVSIYCRSELVDIIDGRFITRAECALTLAEKGSGGIFVPMNKDDNRLKDFYGALKDASPANRGEASSIEKPVTKPNRSKEVKPEAKENLPKGAVAMGDDDLARRVFAENTNLAEMRGEQVDENRDGKIDRVEVENADGTATTFYDDDGDGRLDWLAKDNADGTSTLLIDTNNDGIPDKRVEQDRDGEITYSPINPTATAGGESRQSVGSVETKSEARNNPDLPSETTNNLKDLTKMTKEANKAATTLKSLADLSYESNPVAAPPEPSASLGAIEESLKNAKKVSDGLTTASRIRDVIENPESTERRFDLAKDLYNRGVNAVGGVAGAAVKQYASDVPNLISDVNNAALQHLGSTMDPNSNYNPDMVSAPVIDWIAKPMKIDKPGTRALDYHREGQLEWKDLRSQYGWLEGTKRAVWYYLLDDLRKER